jgi:hypothetical protein
MCSSLHLKVTAEDIRSALEKTQSRLSHARGMPTDRPAHRLPNPSSQINYSDFINTLDLHETNSIGTPFFDSRSNQIKRLKVRARELTEPLEVSSRKKSPLRPWTHCLFSPLTTLPSSGDCLSFPASPRNKNLMNPSLSPHKPTQPHPIVPSSVLSVESCSLPKTKQRIQLINPPVPHFLSALLLPCSLSLQVSRDLTHRQSLAPPLALSDNGDCDSYNTVQSDAYSPLVDSAREL